MRTLLAAILLASQPQSAAAPDLAPALAAEGHARYRLALAILRAEENPAAHARHADPRVAEAAIDAARERIADSEGEPSPKSEQIATDLLGFAAETGNGALATRALHAVAESRNAFGGRISTAMARLALNPACAVRLDAIAALSELGDGSQAATLAKLAGDADSAVAQAARDSLASIQGKGVTETFVRGIDDAALGTRARIALLQAATKRGLVAAAPSAARALGNPSLRLEAQKAVLRLARKEHLAELRAARDRLADAPETRDVLGRLIARLEKE